ncbi:uncharacterized protein LOC132282011 [Cornus florida]|uniref:uncharacterized protein LOC132282011 n=1 Tax=Cornus florida TaxID=4283 RepID=UPI00289A4A2B|nr:uncharacterized protein LOC132282011 [Cornus florida]
MAGWFWKNQKPSPEGLDGNEMVMGIVLSHKPGLDLLQNCDLPPPLKVFAGPDKVLSSMNRVCGMTVQEDESNSGAENEKLDLLKALRLSQTRAREAEKMAAVLAKERDCLCNALVEESMRLLSYRQWVKLLDLQLSKLQRQQQQEEQSCEEEEEEAGGSMTWFVALALCLGITGVGIAFGCRYFF